MSEGVTPLEKDMQGTFERNFVETLNTVASHAEAVVMETGDRDGEHYTDILLVLRDSSHTPDSLRGMQLNLSLDSTLVALVTPEGGGVVIHTPISDGRLEEIFAAHPADHPVDERLRTALKTVRERSAEIAGKKNFDSIRDLTASIAAELGQSRVPPALQS